MDSPIVYFEDNSNLRFKVRHYEGGKFIVEDKKEEFPKFFVESGIAKKICNYLNMKEKEYSLKEEKLDNYRKKINEYENKLKEMERKSCDCYEKDNHYLLDLILNDSNDDTIEKKLEDKVPINCNIESDDLFLRIEYMFDENLINEIICEMLEIPVDCITYISTKKDENNEYWKVLYIDWETISDSIM